MSAPRPATAPLPPAQSCVGSLRVAEHLASAGYLPDLADKLFWVSVLEMARCGRVTLDQVLTDPRHSVVEMRWLCYYVMNKQGAHWADIAARFNKSHDSVRAGARKIGVMLKTPALFKQLVSHQNELNQSIKQFFASQNG